MKKILLMVSLIVVTMTMMAVPAKRGVWKTLTLVNGTEVRAQLVGDEHGRFWQAEDGTAYQEVEGSDCYQVVDAQKVIAKANVRRQQVHAKRAKRMASRRVVIGEQTHYTGKKKGLVILMQFKDTKFKTANNLASTRRYLTRRTILKATSRAL